MSSLTPSDFKLRELNGELLPEPLLAADRTRFVLFPIKHNDVSSPRHPFSTCKFEFCGVFRACVWEYACVSESGS